MNNLKLICNCHDGETSFTHLKDNLYRCEDCKTVYEVLEKTIHRIKGKANVCKECGEIFSSDYKNCPKCKEINWLNDLYWYGNKPFLKFRIGTELHSDYLRDCKRYLLIVNPDNFDITYLICRLDYDDDSYRRKFNDIVALYIKLYDKDKIRFVEGGLVIVRHIYEDYPTYVQIEKVIGLKVW